MENLEKLLGEIYRIYEKHEKEAEEKGEFFNIFEVISVGHREAIHSNFLAELLNPNGSHRKGNDFLLLFLKEINGVCLINRDKIQCGSIDIKENWFNKENTKIETEKHLGRKEKLKGGRVDIAIESPNCDIFIENKIWAGEQNNQLIRYDKGLNKGKEAKYLLYLTLDGKEADSVKEDKDVIYAPISYSGHILNWLEKCQISLENNQSNQTLKKILTQYIVLIRKLTNQPRSKEMGEDYIKTIFEGNNLTSYLIMV